MSEWLAQSTPDTPYEVEWPVNQAVAPREPNATTDRGMRARHPQLGVTLILWYTNVSKLFYTLALHKKASSPIHGKSEDISQ